jgi:Putative zinc ribbon domain
MQPIPPGPVCQSCGMPMSRDENGGGTEMDGTTRSIEYCSHCYRNGMFTEPDLTVDDVIARAQARLQAAGVPEPVIERNLMGMYRLDRWKD